MHEQAKGGRGGRTGHAEEGETPPVHMGGWGHTWDSKAETGSEWVLGERGHWPRELLSSAGSKFLKQEGFLGGTGFVIFNESLSCAE